MNIFINFKLIPIHLGFLEKSINRKYTQEPAIPTVTMVLSKEIVMNCKCVNKQIQFFPDTFYVLT